MLELRKAASVPGLQQKEDAEDMRAFRGAAVRLSSYFSVLTLTHGVSQSFEN